MEAIGMILLASFAIGGMACLYRLTGSLSVGEVVGYGAGIGWTVASLAIAGLATPTGAVTRIAGEVTGIVMLVLATMYLAVLRRRVPNDPSSPGRPRIKLTRTIRPVTLSNRVLPLLGALLLLGWWGMVLVPAISTGIDSRNAVDWVGFPGPDWHGIIPDGIGLTYPTGQASETERPGQPVSILSALLMLYGFSPTASVVVVTSGLLIALIAAIFGLGVRLAQGVRVGMLGVMLFVLGGGVGWLLTAERINATDRPWASLAEAPWDRSEQLASRYTVENSVLGVLIPQPETMLVLLLSILSATILVRPSARSPRWSAGLAGLVSAGAVAADPSAVVLVAAVGLTALVARPTGPLTGPLRSWYVWRAWLAWLLIFGLATGGVIAFVGGPSALVWSPRILTGQDPLLWYWLKNGGWLLPLVVIGLTRWRTLQSGDRRILAIGLPAIVIAHLVAPESETTSSAALVLAMIVVSLIAALAIEGLWEQANGVFARLLVLIVALMTMGSGILVNAQLLLER